MRAIWHVGVCVSVSFVYLYVNERKQEFVLMCVCERLLSMDTFEYFVRVLSPLFACTRELSSGTFFYTLLLSFDRKRFVVVAAIELYRLV